MKKLIWTLFSGALAVVLPAHAQVNSGSNGSDGALNPTSNLVIDMTNRPDGIYHYTSVNIPAGVTVTFNRNSRNTPVVWLVQSTCTIDGAIHLNGQYGPSGGEGGPGGFRGGNMGGGGASASDGQGPGGGSLSGEFAIGGSGSFASAGNKAPVVIGAFYGRVNFAGQAEAGAVYGSQFCLPLTGGSGGGGKGGFQGPGVNNSPGNGGGGGGAILIAASDTINLNGSIVSIGGSGGGQDQYRGEPWAGSGSGGAIRLVQRNR